MSGLLVDQGLLTDSHMLFDGIDASVFNDSHMGSPLSDALGTDELDLLNQLLAFPAPSDPAVAFSPEKELMHKPTRKRTRCIDCSSSELERSTKQHRSVSIDGGKTNKCKSQSQRQKEEISLLKREAEELNAKLAELQERQRQRELISDSAGDSDPSHDEVAGKIVQSKIVGGARRLWEGVAKRQQTELQAVEEENASLRNEVSKRWKQMRSLEQSIIGAQVDQLRQSNRHCLADELSALNCLE